MLKIQRGWGCCDILLLDGDDLVLRELSDALLAVCCSLLVLGLGFSPWSLLVLLALLIVVVCVILERSCQSAGAVVAALLQSTPLLRED